jgi:hypothetical protein
MGYGMLLVVSMAGHDANARTVFDGLLTTVRARPAYTQKADMVAAGDPNAWACDYLMEWRLNGNGSSTGDAYAAADGDMDIAMALLMADRQWGSTGTWNYAQEAADTIFALKVAIFKDGGYPQYRFRQESRTSDWMFDHFRAYGAHSGDPYWTSTAVSICQQLTDNFQTAHSPTAGLIADFLTDCDTLNPNIAPVGSGDPGNVGLEGLYYYNACRNPWRWGCDYVHYGDTNTLTVLKRVVDFFNAKFVAELAANGGQAIDAATFAIDTGYYMDGTTYAGGDTQSFMTPVMVGCMALPAYQGLLNAIWEWCTFTPDGGVTYPQRATSYYEAEIQLLSELIVTKNWWQPRTPPSLTNTLTALEYTDTMAVAGPGGTGGSGGTALSAFTDSFNFLDSFKWAVYTSSSNSHVTAAGTLVVDQYGSDINPSYTPQPKTGVKSLSTFDIIGQSVYVKMTPYTSTGSDWGMMFQNFALLHDAAAAYGVGFEFCKNNRLFFRIWNGFDDSYEDADPATFITYDPVAHAFLRLREASGTIYWETAPDNGSGLPGTWTVRASKAWSTFTNFDDITLFTGASKVFMCTRVNDPGMLDSYITADGTFDTLNGGGSSTTILEADGNSSGSAIVTGKSSYTQLSGALPPGAADLNMLRDTDNDLGFWVAAAPGRRVSGPWGGATLFVAPDGVNYLQLAALNAPATMGVVQLSPLPDFLGGNTVDEASVIRVALYAGTLQSITNDGLLAGFNMAVVGSEVVCFRDVSLNSDGTYNISGFLRGRRGTEFAMPEHVVGERFVLFEPSKWARVEQHTIDLDVDKAYKAVTNGKLLADAPVKVFRNIGAPLKPYSPCQVGGGINASGDWTIQWVRRTRLQGDWRDNVDVPLNEESEDYEVDVYDPAFLLPKTTLAVSGQSYTTYTAAQQLADFGSLQSTLNVLVFQRSATVGRGYQAKVTLHS